MRIYFFLIDQKLQLLFTFLICSVFFSNFQIFSETFGSLIAFEKQPILPIFICILIYIYYLKQRLRIFSFIDSLYSISSAHLSLCCLLAVILLVFIVDTIFNGWGNRFVILFHFLLGPLIYLLISTSQISFHKQILKLFVFSLFLIAMILHFRIVFFYTPLYNFLSEHIPRYVTSSLLSSQRGMYLFASEPSLAAMQLILLYIVVDISFVELKEKLVLLFLIAIMIFWNKSSTGYSLLLLYYFPYVFQKKYFLRIFIGIFCFSAILILSSNNRFVETLVNIKYAFFMKSQSIDYGIKGIDYGIKGIDYGIIGNILVYEPSQGLRIACFILGVLHTFLYPFGNGLEIKVSKELFDRFPILPWEKIFSHQVFVNSSYNVHAYMHGLLLTVGVFSLLLCIFVFCCYYYSNMSNISQKVGILLIISVLFFFQAAFDPIPWILCAILHQYQENFTKIKL